MIKLIHCAILLLPILATGTEIREQVLFPSVKRSVQNDTTFFAGDYYPAESNVEAFPLIRHRILLPAGVVDSSIRVSFTPQNEQTLTGISSIERTGTESELSDPGQEASVLHSNIYKVYLGKYRQFQILDCWIAPTFRDSVSQEIRSSSAGEIVVSFELSSLRSTSSPTSRDLDHLRSTVDNLAILSEYGTAVRAEPLHLAIITTSKTKKSLTKLNDFIASKSAHGFTTTVFTESDWGGGIGEVSADNLHRWLIDNYLEKKIDYVLIIGDPSPETGDIAMKTAYAYYGGKTAATDFYFSDITGNWDADGDGKFGETDDVKKTGGIDAIPDISVGRIPLYKTDYATVDHILAKSISYESESKNSIGWRENTLLVMLGYYGDEGAEVGEAIREDLSGTSRKFYRIYNRNLGGCDEFSITEKGVTAAWIKDSYGIVTWLTHGKEDAALDIMNTTYAKQLTDETPSFVFMGSCLNGKPDVPTNLAYTILAKGAVGVVAGSETTIFRQPMGNFRGMSYDHGLTHGFTLELAKTKPLIGDALASTKEKADMGCWKNYCAFNLYGDPTLGLNSSADPVSIQDAKVGTGSVKMIKRSNELRISVPSGTIRSVELCTISGRVVYSAQESGSFVTIPLQEYAAGSYVIRVESGSGIIVEKVSIQK